MRLALGPLVSSLLLSCAATSCAHERPRTIPLLSIGAPTTLTPSSDVPLELVTRGSEVKDPLPVVGSGVAYADVETALGHAVASGAVPWAAKHRAQRPDGWQLTVEIVGAEAEHHDERLTVAFTIRATLRARAGNTYLAQMITSCRESGLVPAEQGAPVIYQCMTHLGRELGGWLSGVEP